MEQYSTEQVKSLATEEAKKQANGARDELGRIVLKATEEYFPEHTQAKRREQLAQGAAVGFAIGFVLGYLLSR